MKTTYIIFTEQGRIRGRINGSVLKVTSKGTQRVTDFDFSPGMNRGIDSEIANALVKSNEWPKESLTNGDYINYDYKEQNNIEFVKIEGRGINYLNIG